MRSCDAAVANLTPFRGVSADAGTAFEVGFMRALGRPVLGYTNTPLDLVVSHFEYLINLVGDRHVSFGTDYDGTSVPRDVKDAAHLPVLLREFKRRGWSDDRLQRVCHGNFRRVLGAVWNGPNGER